MRPYTANLPRRKDKRTNFTGKVDGGSPVRHVQLFWADSCI
ncbi:MAG TPA: hypothetical protein PK156_09065 [Polyangium sp.]|nr:hypothetical protein [Polyangium sp.]